MPATAAPTPTIATRAADLATDRAFCKPESLVQAIFDRAFYRVLHGGLIDEARYAEDEAFALRVNTALSEAAEKAAASTTLAEFGFEHQVDEALDSALADLAE